MADRLQTDAKQWETVVRAREEELAECSEELRKLRMKIRTRDVEISNLKKSRDGLHQNMKTDRKRWAVDQERLSSTRARNKELEEMVQKDNSEMHELYESRDLLERENLDLQGVIAQRENEIEELRTGKELPQQRARLECLLRVTERKLSSAESALEDSRALNGELTALRRRWRRAGPAVKVLKELVGVCEWMERSMKIWPRDTIEPYAEEKVALKKAREILEKLEEKNEGQD